MKIIDNINNLNLKQIKSDEGKYITVYNDKDNIENFYSTTVMYCPNNFDIILVREIDENTNNEYIKKRDIEMAKSLEENKEGE